MPSAGLCRVCRFAPLVGLLFAAWAPGCMSLDELRAVLRGEPPPGAKLRVEVTPKSGITVLLDGVVIGRASPAEAEGLAEGPHLLEVRAPGYHPVSLPIKLAEREVLTLPVALRRAGPATIPAPGSPPADIEPPSPPPPTLPPGVEPVFLVVSANPTKPIHVDGSPAERKQVRLYRVQGTLEAGALTLAYRVGGGGILELTVPSDDASWQRDGSALKAGQVLRIHRGATRISRTDPSGETQTLVLRRR